MPKVWTTLETVLPLVNPATDLAVTVDGHSIFASNPIWFEFEQKYTEWGFLQNPLSDKAQMFRSLWTNYVANTGEQLLHIWEGMNKEYDPTSNYSMIEMGADGHKQSGRNNTDNTDSVAGTKQDKQDTEYKGTEGNARTVTGKQITDRYENAFDSGLDSNGTHTGRDETSFPTSVNDTRSFTNRKDETTYGNNQSQNITSGTESLSATGQIASAGHTRNNKSETFDNNVSVTGTKIDASGNETSVSMSDLTDGTQHIFSRFGNIGVATAADMLMKEYELRKINLLKDFVHGFILEYCTYIGCDD
jgi:hypothetical protein